MNPKTRQRAMRSFLASLLQSDLSAAEMQDLAIDLDHGFFGKELAQFIREVISNFGDIGHNKGLPNQTESERALAGEIIVRRRLPKRAVLQLMTLASPRIRQEDLPSSGTTGHLLERYFLLASQNEIERFLSILEGEPADAYIKGIANRDRGK